MKGCPTWHTYPAVLALQSIAEAALAAARLFAVACWNQVESSRYHPPARSKSALGAQRNQQRTGVMHQIAYGIFNLKIGHREDRAR
jgi:hypothetical protein